MQHAHSRGSHAFTDTDINTVTTTLPGFVGVTILDFHKISSLHGIPFELEFVRWSVLE